MNWIKLFKPYYLIVLAGIFFVLSTVLLGSIFFENQWYTPLILHYTKGVGDYLGTKKDLLVLWISLTIIFVLNYFIGCKIVWGEKHLTFLIFLITFFLNLLFFHKYSHRVFVSALSLYSHHRSGYICCHFPPHWEAWAWFLRLWSVSLGISR